MITLIGKNGSVVNVRSLRPILTTNMDPIASNATLRKDEWETIDSRVNDVMRERLTVADDLRARGLVVPVSLGAVLRITERMDDFDAADISFDGDTDPSEDRPNFLQDVVPVPVIQKGFRINWRQLEASRQRGDPLDTTSAAVATRKVRDQLQNLITNGYGKGPGTNPRVASVALSIPGLTTAANRLTLTLNTAWDASGSDIIGDVERMLAAAYAVNLFGPFFLYVPKNYWATIQGDYVSDAGAGTATRTYQRRILEFVDIEAVRPLDALADDNVVLVQMTQDVIDLSEAQAVTTIQWQKNPLVTMFRVLSVAGPQIKSIQTDSEQTINGIVHLS
jgi:uncharacterized linocin/CFP29 family protein